MKDPYIHSSPRVRYKPSSHLRGENQASLCSALYSWSLNLVKHQAISWRRCQGTSGRIAHKKIFITNLCKCLSLGRLHLSEYHLVILDLQSILFLFFIVLHIILFPVLHLLLLFQFAFLFSVRIFIYYSLRSEISVGNFVLA
jgi:hypothetical protein